MYPRPLRSLYVSLNDEPYILLQEGLLSPSKQRAACETRILPVGVGAFRPKFYGKGIIPCQNGDTVR